ncbi:unnamed protein product [Amoebophrya sp. A25]|nr:unnamed protein product [Amoebophrya sp. A25]|eukprot:GSA25T00005190001.1
MAAAELETVKAEKYQLQQYADKVTKELHRLVESGGSASSTKRDDLEPPVNLPPWATNMQLMSPLIRVYEDRVRELETILGKSAGLAEQAAALTNENEALREELVQKSEHIAQLQSREYLGGSSSSAGGLGAAQVRSRFEEERDEVDALYRMSIEQNEVLAQQNVLLKAQIEKMMLSLQEMEPLRRRARQSEEVERQRAAAEEELERVRQQLALKVDEVKTAGENVKKSMGREREWERKFEALREESDERVERISAENTESLQQYQELSEELAERRSKYLVLERESVELSDKFQKARREAETLKTESQNMLIMMEQLEKKEKTTRVNAEDLKAKLDVAEKDLSELFLEKTKLEALESTVREGADASERKRKGEMDVMLEEVRRATEGQLELRQKRIDDLEDQLSKAGALTLDLQTKYDFLVKQHAHDQSASESRLQSAEKMITDLRHDLEEMQKRRLSLEEEVFSKSSELQRLGEQLQQSTVLQNRQLQRSTESKAELTGSLENFRQRLQAKEDTCVVTERQNEVLVKRVADLQKQVLSREREYSTSLDDERRKWDTERNSLLSKLKALATKSKAGEQRAIELLKVQEELRGRWQEELTFEKRALEEQVDKLKKQCLQLRMGAVLNNRR